jgi:hypothetical protein
MKECTPGSANYLNAVKALNELNARERDELIKLGLVPSDLSIATTTSYHYVSFVGQFNSSEEAQAAANKRDAKHTKVYDSDEDNAIRQQLEAEYGETTTSNTDPSSTEGE